MSAHKIEESVKVYLYAVNGKWEVDRVSLDGYPLDSSLEHGPDWSCDDLDVSEYADHNMDECLALRESMARVPLPTAEELLALLADALGCVVLPKWVR